MNERIGIHKPTTGMPATFAPRAWHGDADRARAGNSVQGPASLPGHDFSRVPSCSRSAQGTGRDMIVHQSGGSGAGAGSGSASPAPAASAPITVDRIDIVDSPAGAIGGYSPVTSGDLNTPGPFNNTTTGGVSNVHQIHFHLDQGNSASLTPRREIQRSAWIAGVENKNPPDRPVPPGHAGPPTPGGFNGVIVGPDGPAAHEIKRPSTDKIVVADAPGAAALAAAQFPFIYRSHFSVTVAAGSTDVARIRYDVRIEKTSAANVPNVENSITAVSKEDMVRGRSLP